jgi:hypothetical protein
MTNLPVLQLHIYANNVYRVIYADGRQEVGEWTADTVEKLSTQFPPTQSISDYRNRKDGRALVTFIDLEKKLAEITTESVIAAMRLN